MNIGTSTKLTTVPINNLTDQLKRDEGLRLTAYEDSRGILTIGYGHNMIAHPADASLTCTLEQAECWLTEDIQMAQLNMFEFLYFEIDEVREGVLTNMCFNMGMGNLIKFKNFLKAVAQEDYTLAAGEMLNSKWALQVGARATRLAKQMEIGEWQ
jgi:lysozyme